MSVPSSQRPEQFPGQSSISISVLLLLVVATGYGLAIGLLVNWEIAAVVFTALLSLSKCSPADYPREKS